MNGKRDCRQPWTLSAILRIFVSMIACGVLAMPLSSWGAEPDSQTTAKELYAKTKQHEAKVAEVADSIAYTVNEMLSQKGIDAVMAEYTLETMKFQGDKMHATMSCRITCAPGETGPVCTPKCQKLPDK